MLPMMNANTATLKIVMQKLATRFGMEFADLKAQWRPRIKALMPNMLELCKNEDDLKDSDANEDTDAVKDDENEKEAALRLSRQRVIKKRNAVVDSSDEEEEAAKKGHTSEDYRSSSGDEDATHSKKRRTTSRNSKVAALPRKKAKTAMQADSPGLASLKELGRAAGILNPQVYKYLKSTNSTEEAEEYLRERLNKAGITFHGTYPTSRDISAAKKKHAKEKELEGIDTSLILSSGRPRRGVRQVSYKENSVSGNEDNVEKERDDEEEDDEGNYEDQVAASDSDSSEATF